MSNDVKKPQPLSTRHANWIIGWALEACALAIIKCEEDLVRHQGMIERGSSEGVVSHVGLSSALDINRHEKVQQLQHSLNEYHEVYRFLKGTRAMVMNKDATEFAEQMARHFQSMKGRKA